jgi:hypothetical protein
MKIYAPNPRIKNPGKNQILMPIIIKKRAHRPFIKRPTTTANPATIVGEKNINPCVSHSQNVLTRPYKGRPCNTDK